MFNSLLGTITEKNAVSLCLDTGSIEWHIYMSGKALEKLRLEKTERIYTYLQHQENGMTLFGFISKKERLLFLDLLKVNGIGPKQAIKILSNVDIENLVSILDSGDAEKLKTIPGVGKTTAQKILLTLKGKLTTEADFTSSKVENFEYADIVTALCEMGFDRKASFDCVKNTVSENKAKNMEISENELLRACIVKLSSNR